MADDGDGGWSTAMGGLVFFLGPALLVCAVMAGVNWWNERDLRDLDALTRTTAEVVEVDQGNGYFRDDYEVRFRSVDGVEVRTEIPARSAVDGQRQVEVAYDPAHPDRVRTVEDWEPLYERLALLSLSAVATWVVAVLWDATRGLRTWLRSLLPGRPG